MKFGHVKHYNADRGFGFILPDDGTKDLFFHIRDFLPGDPPEKGARVCFEVGTGTDGRPRAECVDFAAIPPRAA